MSSALDCNFYVSFYDDLENLKGKNAVDVNEHYINIGQSQGRVANKNELNDVVCKIIHFDSNTYSTANLSNDNVSNYKSKNPNMADGEWLNHFYNEPFGQLYRSNTIKIQNGNDLKKNANKWESMYIEIFNEIKFNANFYRSFYVLPAGVQNTRELKLNWLKNGLFNKEYPNIMYLNNNDNMIGVVQIILISKFGLDMAYLSGIRNEMHEYARANNISIPQGLVDETSILLFLFLNTGYQLRVFFNQNERKTYMDSCKLLYTNAIKSVKTLSQTTALGESNKEYVATSLQLAQAKQFVGVPIVKYVFSEINSLINIIKLSNELYINCSKKIYSSEDLTTVTNKIIRHEISNYDNPIINSMDFKIFVMSLVYNIFILNKGTDKEAYKNLVKTKSTELLTPLLNEAGVSDFSVTLEQDLDYILNNKQVIKLSYFKNVVMSVLAGLFTNIYS
jgi:hypothetical protein